MSNPWVVRALGEDLYEWNRSGRAAQASLSERGNRQAMLAAAQAPLTLLVDGRAVRTLEAAIPARSQRQAQQAAPFAVEEELADDLEQLQVVCGFLAANGKRAVAVVGQAFLRNALEPFTADGAQLARMLPDYLALPQRVGHWSVLKDGARLLVRTGAQAGFACDLTLFDSLANRLGQDQRPRGLDLFGDVTVPGVFSDLPQQQHALPQGVLALLAQGVSEANALDLRPAHYRSDGRQRAGGLRVAAVLGLLALGVHLGFGLRETHGLQAALAATRTAQAATMRNAFPAITRVVNAEVQAAQGVAELRGHAGATVSALELLHRVGRGMRMAETPTLALETLNYADGILSVRLAAPDIASLEHYSEALKPFVQVEVVAVEARENGVGGSLRVQPVRGAPP